MVRFDWDADAEALATLGRDFGRQAAGAEREAEASCRVPPSLAEEALALGLLDLTRPEAAGGPGIPLLALGHTVAALVAEAPGIGTALLLPEAAGLFQAPRATGLCDGGLAPATLSVVEGEIHGEVGLALLPQATERYWFVAATDDGERLCQLAADAVSSAPVSTMGLNATCRRALTLHGRADVLAPFGRRERARLYLYVAPFFHGYGRAALRYALAYAAQRRAFGRPIGGFQGVAFPLAEVAMELEAAELLWQQAAWQEDDLPRAARALGAAREAAYLAANTAVGILGGHGYVDDHPVERWLRDVVTLAGAIGGREALALAASPEEVDDSAGLRRG
jgi:alkylation response protein AidB-like acyl-CoA dehydrogenase